MNASLVMFNSQGKRRRYVVTKPLTLLGRKHECDLRIPFTLVSRHHCRLEVRDDGLYVVDLGTTNGTFVNNQRVHEAKLNPGDHLIVGPVRFVVVIDGQPAEIEPIRSKLPWVHTNVGQPGSADSTIETDAPSVLEAEDDPDASEKTLARPLPRPKPRHPNHQISDDDIISLLEDTSED